MSGSKCMKKPTTEVSINSQYKPINVVRDKKTIGAIVYVTLNFNDGTKVSGYIFEPTITSGEYEILLQPLPSKPVQE